MSQAETEAYNLGSRCRAARERTGAWPEGPAAGGRATAADPWGRPWRLDVAPDGDSAVIRSAGPDGDFDTADDVLSPRNRPRHDR